MYSVKAVKLPLPYFEDSARLFAPLANRPWAVFLDSAHDGQHQGRYDIMAYGPVCTLQTFGGETLIRKNGAETRSAADPFAVLKSELGPPLPSINGLPFNGGAIGYFAYDLARRIEKLPQRAVDAEQVAEMAVGIYRWAVVVDHHLRQSWLLAYDADAGMLANLRRQFSQPAAEAGGSFEVLSPPQANMDKAAYARAFGRIKSYLKEGDCYQVNLTQRFSSPCRGEPWLAYRVLRQINAAPFSAYLNLPDVQVLSSSPERFLRVSGRQVETRPIKGTRPRSPSPDEDARQMADLANSEKDRAENVMIVDLLRNDLGKTCRDGSVRTPKLFAVESYATVHHLVSTVTGELAAGQHALDLLRSCFPGGSITGAPKIRAMEIIEELEPQRRGIYCGAIGYIGFDGDMDTNIVIRTLIHNQGSIRFWVGGGIVNDSQLDAEYQECFDKAQALLQLLEQFRA
ncbi:MAG: aminodeoxychorismate synthase component I [Methylococcales bacterium]|nr:aminodeoxychorismate synthase component I [Methylococcales bacterium]